eukprot:GGOE01013600.1.p2 GENE.GGOE01013600.1~~GGOE01013600.1.p2  ORF type:complete len:107 (+),score=24.32 GGOE01013600.1:41-361(+)
MLQGYFARIIVSVLTLGGGGIYLERNTTDFKPSNIVVGAESVAQDISQAKPLTNLKDGWNQSLRNLQEAVFKEWADLNAKNRQKCDQRLHDELVARGYKVVSLQEA